LVRAYSEPHRAYHNLRHIDDCLRLFDDVQRLALRPIELEMALWFHDVVYSPRAKDNEERSAEWARGVCRRARFAPEFEAGVATLILATRHDAPPSTPDAGLVVDIDLSVLGRPPAEFDAYEAAIREEFRWVPDLLFRPGRAKVLQSFLARPAIYTSDFFRDRYERQARANLERSLSRLR
jgi:predicted metal-dependent HD superfamily phosphohydrolase